MAITLVGKVVMSVVTLAVLGGMAAVVTLVVTHEDTRASPASPAPPGEPTTETGEETTTGGATETPAELLYEVGVGIADMTGPCAEITFMGYAETAQRGTGLHTRQFARAFIFKRGESRVVLVSAEVQAVGIAVRRQVVQNLQERYGDIYSLRNVIVSGTHTHSAPGGHLVDFLLDISILGFSSETYNAYVDGITRSIVRAHENMVPARLFFGSTRVWNVHMNRSPYSYLFNPPEERARYDLDTDNTLTQVRVVKADGSLHGVLSWFAVHTTSMNMSNTLVSSDNLGYAALRLEGTLNPASPAGKPEIVAGMFVSNLGDVSPNTRGARCEFSGEQCDNQFLLCQREERCFSLGPGDDMFESTRIVGEAIYEGALEVLNSPGEELTGDIKVIHQFVEMPEQTVAKYDPVTETFNTSEPVSGCVAAMGYSFASGTIDGANTLNITQGTIEGNPLLDTITGIVMDPTEEDIECHAPKPILLATGRGTFPIPWHPKIVSLSLIWLADFVVAGVPGEPTTMSGRRIRAVVGAAMEGAGVEPRVAVSALTNEYMHYVVTREEYQVQRYEAASTIFGPNTLDILLNKFSEFTTVAIQGGDVDAGETPEDYRGRTLSLILPVLLDSAPLGTSFGDVLQQPPPAAPRGATVSATFVGANPRNDLKQESTHIAVQRLELGEWVTVATDADWDTKFQWERASTLAGTSLARAQWTIPAHVLAANYRLAYFGVARSLLGALSPFAGYSQPFLVVD